MLKQPVTARIWTGDTVLHDEKRQKKKEDLADPCPHTGSESPDPCRAELGPGGMFRAVTN